MSFDVRGCSPQPAHHALAVAWTVSVNDYTTALAASPDGTLLAVGSATGRLLVFEARSGALRFQALAHPHGITSIRWSPVGHILATGGQDGRALLFDPFGRVRAELAGDASSVDHVAWAPHGRYLATASGGVARVWNESGEPIWKTDPHESAVTGLGWNRRGTEFATASSGGLHLFRVAPTVRARRFPRRGSLTSLAWSPTDAIVACGTDEHSVHFWRVATGRDSEIATFPAKPRALSWDAMGRLLATSGNVTVNVWSFDRGGPEGMPPIQLVGHQALCTAVAFGPREETLASGGDDMTVLVWSPRRETMPRACGLLEDTVTGLAWTADEEFLVATDAVGTVRAWHAE
ncbi:MAG TPA: WD40 repeat domain-containing protein [Polyangiaceae bacterium]